MSISGISLISGSRPAPAPVQSIRSRVEEDFAEIAQSLQANDVAGARHAYADLAQVTPVRTSIAKDFASLGTALNSGNVGGAQAALSKLQTETSHKQTTHNGKTTAGGIFSGLVKTGLSLLG